MNNTENRYAKKIIQRLDEKSLNPQVLKKLEEARLKAVKSRMEIKREIQKEKRGWRRWARDFWISGAMVTVSLTIVVLGFKNQEQDEVMETTSWIGVSWDWEESKGGDWEREQDSAEQIEPWMKSPNEDEIKI